jgi:hypothetical protein
MKKFIVIISFLAVLFFSCPEEDPNNPNNNNQGNNNTNTDPIDAAGVTKKSFYVQNYKTNGVPVSVEAGLLADGKNCHVWVGRGANITKEKAKNIANTYDNDIYNKMIKYFSIHEDDELVYDEIKLKNTFDIVPLLVNGDGKLNIVLVDIPDNYQQGVNNAYTAGYFWNGDLYERNTAQKYKYSNECAAIFIDTYPGVPGSEESNSTLAHEMQHLMSFLNSAVSRPASNGEWYEFDTWIDEGLSLSAEYLYLGKQLTARVNWYKNDQSGLISKGNNFFVWGNRSNESNYYSLDDYATVYLFFQWLRLQTNNDIYWSIMFSDEYDHNAVVNAYYDSASASNKINDWDTLLKTWLAANQINASSGLYGYRGQLTDIKAHAAPAVTSINLYPGEGVYSKASVQPNTSGSGNNIKYAYLTTNSVNTSYSANSTLLTYNVNTNSKGSSEKGVTTGAASVHIVPDARFIASLSNEPIRIDARDMMGRDEWLESYSNGGRLRRRGNNE